MSTIKAGYRITVTSWENDADNYNTSTTDGLDEQEARYHVDLLKLIKGSHCNNKNVFGNLYEPRDSEVKAFEEAIQAVFYKHGKTFPDDMALDVAMDIVGDYTGYSDGYMTRVAEKITVEYVPEEIFIEDVTKQFGV
jgi:hypothetical protein